MRPATPLQLHGSGDTRRAVLVSLACALPPVLLGTAAVFVPRGLGTMRADKVLRWVALAAAVAVIVLDLLPEAFEEGGISVAPVFLLGAAAPWLAGKLTRQIELGVELAFLALVAHQLIDGLQIAAARALGAGIGVTLAVAAHAAPIVIAALMGYAEHDGRAIALKRAGWLAVGTAAGVAVGSQAGTGWMAPIAPWLSAGLAGLLLYVVGHGFRGDHDHHDEAVQARGRA